MHNESCYQDKVYADISTSKFGTINDTASKIKNKSKYNSGKSVVAKKINKKIVTFSHNMLKLKKPLRAFLMERLYHHYRVMRMSIKAKRFIQELFKAYVDNPKQLPTEVQNKIPGDGVKRAVCDYIAAMTDRYALDEYKKLFTPYEKV